MYIISYALATEVARSGPKLDWLNNPSQWTGLQPKVQWGVLTTDIHVLHYCGYIPRAILLKIICFVVPSSNMIQNDYM